MAIASGRRLGSHEILSAVGAGGMGEVYRARDTRLDRIVAIKVLQAHLADKPDLRERFEREARTIAGLNHPHISVLYDIGSHDGMDFLVLEYLEGETLAARLSRGALPVQQLLTCGIEIADALDKAHHKGITHRDLKPGNIMLTVGREAPRLRPGEAEAGDLADRAALEARHRGPERADGPGHRARDVSVHGARTGRGPRGGRAHIFAFGAVLYEMATGKRAFEGKTQASIMRCA
jgi:serine/threonine protein kinase